MKIAVRDIERAIKDIQKLDQDLRKLGTRATPDIVGFYGELLAWKELKSKFGWRGYNIEFGSGQSRADIVLRKKDKKINIEVKTSRLKEEKPGTVYGFAINVKKCMRHLGATFNHPKRGKIKGDFCYFGYILAVALSDDLKTHKFYIFPRRFIEANKKSLRNRSKQFSSHSHRIIFIEKLKNSEGFIATYYPDFFVKNDEKTVYIVETKGREEDDDKLKFERLQKWCADVNERQSRVVYKALYIKQEDWKKDKLKNFDEVVRVFNL